MQLGPWKLETEMKSAWTLNALQTKWSWELPVIFTVIDITKADFENRNHCRECLTRVRCLICLEAKEHFVGVLAQTWSMRNTFPTVVPNNLKNVTNVFVWH